MPRTRTTTPVPTASTRAGALGSRKRRSASNAEVASTAAAHTRAGDDADDEHECRALGTGAARDLGLPADHEDHNGGGGRRDRCVQHEQPAMRHEDHERDQADGHGHDPAAGIGQVRDGNHGRNGGEGEHASGP